MDDREQNVLTEIGTGLATADEEAQHLAAAIVNAYAAGKAAGEKKAAAI